MIISLLILILFSSSQADAREPTIQEVQQQAIHYLEFDQVRMDGWDKRAKVAAALPRLQVGFQRELHDVVSLTTRDNVSITGGDVLVGPSENNFDQNFNQGTTVGVKALWYLDQLVFNRDMLAASAERRAWIHQRGAALEQVTEAYFTRRRLLKELKKKRDPLVIREKKKLLVDKAEAVIDGNTGGWFSSEIEKGERK